MVRGNVLQNHSIGPHDRMVTDMNGAQELGSRTNLHVATNDWRPTSLKRAQGDLLKNQAVWSHLCIRMDHNSIGVRQDEPTSNPAIQGNIRASDRTPEAMSEGGPSPHDPGKPSSLLEPLVISNTFYQSFCRAPRPWRDPLALPVWLRCADLRSACLVLIHVRFHWENCCRAFLSQCRSGRKRRIDV